jgi:ribosomal protein L36
MPKVLKIKDIDKVKNKIKSFFSAHEDARFVRRLNVIALICDGHPIHYVADLFDINPSTVQRWIHRINIY